MVFVKENQYIDLLHVLYAMVFGNQSSSSKSLFSNTKDDLNLENHWEN